MKNGNGITKKIDRYGEVDEQIKKLEKEKKALRKELILYGKKHKIQLLEGKNFDATFMPNTLTTVEPIVAYKALQKLGHKGKEIFNNVFSVKLGELRNKIGNDELEKITVSDVDYFGKIKARKKE